MIRSDRGDDRPDFTAVVDALLEISDSVSESKHTEVSVSINIS